MTRRNSHRLVLAGLAALVVLSSSPFILACGGGQGSAPTAMKASYNAPGSKESGARQDIVETALAAGSFKTLAKALEAAGLVQTLKGAGPFTVFAPTDEAFAKLPAGTVEKLLANPEQLKAVLTYHVVPGKVLASQVVKMDSARTVQGSTVTIDASNGVRVNNASVVKTDIMASNGVIHVIDTVILPPA